MIDGGIISSACTVLVARLEDSFVLGRNFDFEGSRTLDEQKFLKWVFPVKGNAFVSVTWPGMVGVVTGINDRGLYISLNSAGSEDFVRYGTPTTLIALEVLQFANDIESAIQIIRSHQSFITDIFTLADSKTGRVFRLEKSPKKFAEIELTGDAAIANQLEHPIWKDDKYNQMRIRMFTTSFREQRGRELLSKLPRIEVRKSKPLTESLLHGLRDKALPGGQVLELGDRRAIDALIATHSVIFDANENSLFVSEGPSLVGKFWGYDLKQSFRERRPVISYQLPKDPEVSEDMYQQILKSRKSSL